MWSIWAGFDFGAVRAEEEEVAGLELRERDPLRRAAPRRSSRSVVRPFSVAGSASAPA